MKIDKFIQMLEESRKKYGIIEVKIGVEWGGIMEIRNIEKTKQNVGNMIKPKYENLLLLVD